MLKRAAVGYVVLAASLAFVMTPARACEGLRCLFAKETKPAEETKPAGAPLKLDTFTRRKSKTARTTAVKRPVKSATSVTARKKAVKRARSKEPSRQAERTPAIAVRVVASSEVNEIDLRADPPKATTERRTLDEAFMAFAEEPLQPARVSVANIDRKSQLVLAARPVEVANEREPSPTPSVASDNWATHLWTRLQTTISNVATAVRRLGE